MPRLLIDQRGISLEYESDCVIIRGENRRQTIPISRIEQLICFHNTVVSTQLLGQLVKRGIDFVVVNQRYENSSLSIISDQQHNVMRRCQQYEWQKDSDMALALAKQICQHKVQVFARIAQQTDSTVDLNLNEYREMLSHCASHEQLRGVEGYLQRLEFEWFKRQLSKDFKFEKRHRRPPPDPVNALLSLTYTLLYYEAARCCKQYGLDPFLGFYHRGLHGRYSLACDLMEPMRPCAEVFVLSLTNSDTIKSQDFSFSKKFGCTLGKDGRQKFYQSYGQFITDHKKALLAGAKWLSNRIDLSIAESDLPWLR